MFHNSVSVVIPNYNNSSTIEAAILSCLIQGVSLREIIVIDDQSTDDSLNVLKKIKSQHPNKLLYFSNPEKGGNNARNYGFSKSTGNFIQWLDADDELLPGKFEAQLSSLSDDEHCVAYSDWFLDTYEPLGNRFSREKKRKAIYQDFIFEILSDNWSVPANYLFTRKIAQLLHEMDAWNPVRRIAQDREYVTLAALSGAKFVYVQGYYSIYNRYSVQSVSKMPFDIRLGLQLGMDAGFREIILNAPNLVINRKKYCSSLNSHALNACFYCPNLTIRYSFSFFNINWKIIHYKKYPFIPFIYLWQHCKLFAFNLFKKKF